tara:strand:- start:508 stop:1074 length:567 start_codon:yes stop_codon:yes gene_type:complete
MSNNNIEDVLVEDNGILIRNYNKTHLINPIEKNKEREFIYIIEKKTNEIFNEKNWNAISIISPNDSDKSYCICSQKIETLYYIQHIPTELIFAVGSNCVNKISNKLYLDIVKTKCICGENILDRRTSSGRLGYCSKKCMPMIIKFGKYKNKLITDIPESYIKWLYKLENIYDDLKENIKLHYKNILDT